MKLFLILACLVVSQYLQLYAQEVKSKGGATVPPTQPQQEAVAEAEEVLKPKQQRTGTLSIGPSVHIAGSSVTNISLPQIPSCCSEYTGTGGSGFSLFGEYAIALSPNVDLLARLSFQSASTTLTGVQPTTIRVGNAPVQTEFQYTYNGLASLFMAEPAIEFRAAGGLGILAGVRVGALLSGTYDHSEKLGDPSIPYEFVEGGSERNVTNGNIPSTTAFQFGAQVGLRYHIPLTRSGTIQLMPEAAFLPMFTSVSSLEGFYGVSSYRFALSIGYVLFAPELVASPISPNR